MGNRNKLKWGKKKDITDVTEVKKKKKSTLKVKISMSSFNLLKKTF